MMIRLSKTSKMPAKSWSLQALETCPGSKNADGSLVDACSGCYATTGMYNMPNVKQPRIDNKLAWKQPDFVKDMVQAIKKDKYFRWFDSGDMYQLSLAQKIYLIMRDTPETQHWMPTRMYKFAKFAEIIAKMEALPNVVVRFSSDSITGVCIDGANTSTIIPNVEDATEGMTVCEAYSRGGKCGDCRACWDKDVSVVAYPQHGKKMQSVFAKLKVN